jgi:outer membrane receptor protein involved in Fe transport
MKLRLSRFCVLLIGLMGPIGVAPIEAAVEESPPGQDQAPQLAEIIVTGTRLKLAAEDAPVPVIVLTSRDIERDGEDSIAKVLESLPMNTGSPLNTSTDNGFGAARVNLRGLGSERTLVLVNGRRFPNGGLGGDASVDLNMLPVSLVERVEVLANGASAVHGSDAIGGVVNAVMRPRGDGVSTSWRITDQGDGEILSASAGLEFDAFGFEWGLAVDYVHQEGITAASRDYSERPLIIGDREGTLVYAGQLGIPDGLFDVPDGNALGLEPGLYMRIPGSAGQAASDYRPFTRDDAYNQSQYNYSQMPNERGSVWLLGSRHFGESQRFFLEAFFHRRESSAQGTPDQYLTTSDPSPTLEDGTPIIPASNFYNPFGVDVPFATRRFVERGERHGTQEIDAWRAVAGIQGKLGGWNWNVAAGIAESESMSRQVGGFASSRFITALGPSGRDASGQVVCGEPDPLTGIVPVANVIAGCVPLDIFNGAGTITQDQLDYMSPRPLVNSGTNDQRIAEIVFNGTWGSILDRDLQWVYGGEYRRESGSFVEDPLRRLGFDGLGYPKIAEASFEVAELFAEAQIPLLHDRRGILDSAVTFGARWSDFSSFGGNLSWEAGLVWQPIAPVRLRATYATAFRAPSLFELYENQTIAAEGGFDPCGNDPTPEQQENCAANGVPSGAYIQGEDEFAVIRGGNPDLDPETGDSFGVGATYLPAWAPGLTFSLDYYDIELTGQIGAGDVELQLADCADTGRTSSCDTILRAADGSLLAVVAANQNLARRRTSGIDFGVGWKSSMHFGELGAGLLATYLERWEEKPYAGGPTFEHAGTTHVGALPRWRATGHIDWSRGPWHASYSVDYVGSMTEVVTDFPFFGIVFEPWLRRVPSFMVHDVEGGYEFGRGLGVRVAISNFTDEDPPFINAFVPENTDTGTYPLLGRTYFLQVSYRPR